MLTLHRGDILADRFEVSGDEAATVATRESAWSAFIEARHPSTDLWDEPDLWLRGIDTTTGAPVLIEALDTPGSARGPAADIAARHVAAHAPPYTVEVLHLGRYVVYAEPPRGEWRAMCSRAEAAELALQACEVTSRLHVAGIEAFEFDPMNLRVVHEGDRARIHWLVPGAFAFAELAESFWYGEQLIAMAKFHDPRPQRIIKWHLANLVNFFFMLQPKETRFSGQEPEVLALTRIRRNPDVPTPPDVAALAQLFLPLASASPDAHARVAALPSVTVLPRGERPQVKDGSR